MYLTYDTAFDRILGHEGAFQDDPGDRGNWTSGEIGVGELKGTKWGISAMSYPDEDIRNLTKERAKYLHKRDFWDKVRGDSFHAAIAYQLFDAALNHGIGNAIRLLQRAAGVSDDGVFGSITRSSIRGHNVDDLLHKFNAERLLFYTRISTFSRYGKGWVRRVAQNMQYAAFDYTAPWYEQVEV